MWLLRRAMASLARQGRLPPAPRWWINILYSLVASMGALLTIWENGDRVADHLKATLTVRRNYETFDFIIIGGGSAGSVLASRLSENPDWKILLIEAGGEPHPLQSIPIFAFSMLNHPQTDWMHKTVPQKNSCFGLVDQSSGWSQGKSLGGTSNINFLLYFRGNPKDFDNWAEITGDPSWRYEEVVNYFRVSEDFDGEWQSVKQHGFGGPLHVQRPSYTGFDKEYIKAGEEMGYQHTDLNGNYTEGFDTCYYAMKYGRRHATYKSFIQPARRRPNLVIYKYAHVNKILFRNGTNEAYGVQYDRYGSKRYAYATKEIILSAGAVQSPKILMLSGIGPQSHLEELKIPVVSNLPVGKNVQDHISTYLGPFELDSDEIVFANFEHDLTPRAFFEYSTRGTGPMTSSGVQASGLFTSSYAKEAGETEWPDLQLFLLGVSVHKDFGKEISRSFHLQSEKFIEYYSDSVGKNSFHQIVSLARPKSRGEILLERNDPYSEPLIDPKYFENEDDLKVMLEGVKKAIYLAENTTTFSRYGTKFTNTTLPGCKNIPFRSDEYFECYVRTYSVTLHHIVGSCSMGRNDSLDAVVDSEFRVLGINGLRVIDASVMPVVPVSNTQAPTIMLAEKGASLIKRDWIIVVPDIPDFEETTVSSTNEESNNSTTASSTVIDIIIPNPTNETKLDSSNSVLTDCDYCELDGRKEDLNLQFAL